MVTFFQGQTLSAKDLHISINDRTGTPTDPEAIYYSIFDTTTGYDILIGAPNQTPASPSVGQYYASLTVPLDANIGAWVIRWNFKENGSDQWVQVSQEFTVVERAQVVTSVTEICREKALLRRLRMLLRDNNPDRNYRFRPPNTDKFLQTQTEVFGYIWEDEELYEYLLMAVEDVNSRPPAQSFELHTLPTNYGTLVTLKAAAFACMAITMNWIADEFDYSISGISLNIDKSSKYQSMKENFEGQYDSTVEQVKKTVLYAKGLKQPRYGIGISSALGPFSREGVQSRRNYIGA